MTETTIIGAGLTGLAAAATLRGRSLVLESEDRPGGCLRTDVVGPYRIDRTGHLFHMRSDTVMSLLGRGEPLQWLEHERDARVQVCGRLQPYPIQYNLHGLPADVVTDCLVTATGTRPLGGRGVGFETWARSNFGDGLWRLFFEPYNEKLWQCDLEGMTADWTGRFVPQPDFRRMVRGALEDAGRDGAGYNGVFAYPADGASQAIPDALETAAGEIEYGARAVAVDWRAKRVTLQDGREIGYGRLISTMPLPALVAMLQPAVPELAEAVAVLRHQSIGYVAFAGRAAMPAWHWVYLADRGLAPFRVGNLGSYGRGLTPAGEALICVERAFPGHGATETPDAELVETASAALAAPELGLDVSSLRPVHVGRLDPGYVIFDTARPAAVRAIRGWLQRHDIATTGRYGAWTYGSAGDAILQGIAAARWARRGDSA